MKKAIYKYPLEINDETTLFLPVGAEILTAQIQYRDLVVWAIVDPEEQNKQLVTFSIMTTGPEFDYSIPRRYISTVQLNGGGLIFHVFLNLSK